MRLFLRNPSMTFSEDEVARLTKLSKKKIDAELGKFLKLNFITKRTATVVVSNIEKKGKARKIKLQQKKLPVYGANQAFEFFKELRELILRQVPEARHKLIGKLRKVGKVKLAIASGAFINNEGSRVDLFIVGDNVSRRKIESMLAHWEANAGRPLTYTLMTPEEFRYRLDMFDRFTRDVLESPHDKLINALNIS